MNRKRNLIAATAAATALVGSGAGVALAASSDGGGSQTLTFNSVQTSETRFGMNFVDADKDVQMGTQIGSDVVDGTFHPRTQTFDLSIAGALKGGLIYGTGVGNGTTGEFHGKVTGGTGIYEGVTGTITGRSYGKNDDNEHLTITYHQ